MGVTNWTVPFLGDIEENSLEDRVVIPFGRKVAVLMLPEFDAEIDTNDFLKIDYSNIMGELITFPIIMNRIGLLRAEMEEIVKTKKFEAEIYTSKLKAYYRKKMTSREAADGGKLKKPTIDEVNDSVLADEGYQLVQRNLIRTEKGFAQIESCFWSAKDKSHKLDKIAEKLSPKEFEKELVAGAVNAIYIKIKDGKW